MAAPRSPMGGRGMSMDSLSGRPLEPEWFDPLIAQDEASLAPEVGLDMRAVQERVTKETYAERRISRHQALLNDLVGDGGRIVRHVAVRLMERIEELVKEDPKASTLMRLLEDAQEELQAGEVFVRQTFAAVMQAAHVGENERG